MNSLRLSMLSRMAALAALSGPLLGACGETGSAGGSASAGASRAATAAETRALVDAPSEADVPPAIALHPHPLMVREGEPAMFSVTGVMGGHPAPVYYQWRRNGVDIPGATKDHLILGTTSLGDDGAQYTVVISNAAGQVISRPGLLAVVSAGTEMPWR